LKVGFGLRKDSPVEEIEVDISSIDEEENAEEPDVEGDVEVDEDSNKEKDQADEDNTSSRADDELWKCEWNIIIVFRIKLFNIIFIPQLH